MSLLCDWLAAFYEEVREPTPTSLPRRVRELVSQGRFFLRVVDGSPVSMAAMVRETPFAGVLSFVYTPSAQRGRGYGAACVASACNAVFELGKRWCALNSRATNTPANAVYRRVGFSPVAELRQVTFEDVTRR